jgi:hypothetical protein
MVSDHNDDETPDNRFAWKPEDIEIINEGDARLDEEVE